MAHPRLDTALTSVLANYFFRKQPPLNEDTEDFIKVAPPSSKRKNAQIAGCGSRNRLSHRYTALYSSYLAFARSSRHFSHFSTIMLHYYTISIGLFVTKKPLHLKDEEAFLFSIIYSADAAEDPKLDSAGASSTPSAGAEDTCDWAEEASPFGAAFSRTMLMATSNARSSCGSSSIVKS